MQGTSRLSKLLNLSNFGGYTLNCGGLGAACRYALGATETNKWPWSSRSTADSVSNAWEKSTDARKPFMRNELKCTTSSFGRPFRTFVKYPTGKPSQPCAQRTSSTLLACTPEKGTAYMVCQPSTLARKNSAAVVTSRARVSHEIGRSAPRLGSGVVMWVTVLVRVSYETTLAKSPNAFVMTYSTCARAGSRENLGLRYDISPSFSVVPGRVINSGSLGLSPDMSTM